MNRQELVRQLASDRYSEKECQALLRKDHLDRAAEYLRATDPPRATDLAIRLLESATYETQARVLMAERRLLSTPGKVFIRALTDLTRVNQLGADQKKALVRPLVEWFEHGQDEHLERLDQEVSGLKLHNLAALATLHRPSFSRLWRLIELKLGATFEEKVTAILETKASPFVGLAAAHLAETLEVELSAIPTPFSIGGVPKEDVDLHNFKPMLELVWRVRPDLLESVVATPCKAVRSWGVPWMLDFLDPTVSMVDAAPSRTIVLRAERLVVSVSGTFKKQGRLSLKVHKTDAAASKDVEKRLTAAEAKLGATRSPWDGVSGLAPYRALSDEGLGEALRAAVKVGRTADVESLLQRGADPRADEALLSLASEYGVVRRLLEAGVTHGLATALLGKASRNQSSAWWSTLNSQTCIALIRAGSDVAQTDHKGWTALHHAAAHGWMPLLDALLDAGADKAARTASGSGKEGLNAAELADANGWHRVVARLR